MIHLAIAAPALLGFALLLMAMTRHQQDWLRRKLSSRLSKSLRWSGLGMLVLAFVVAGLAMGWAYGSVVWFGWLSVAAALVLAGQTNRERIQRMLHLQSHKS